MRNATVLCVMACLIAGGLTADAREEVPNLVYSQQELDQRQAAKDRIRVQLGDDPLKSEFRKELIKNYGPDFAYHMIVSAYSSQGETIPIRTEHLQLIADGLVIQTSIPELSVQELYKHDASEAIVPDDIQDILAGVWKRAGGASGYDWVSINWPYPADGNHTSEKSLFQLARAGNGRPRFFLVGVSYRLNPTASYKLVFTYFDGTRFRGLKNTGASYDVLVTSTEAISNARLAVMPAEKPIVTWTEETPAGPMFFEINWSGANWGDLYGNVGFPLQITNEPILFGDVASSPQNGDVHFTWTTGQAVKALKFSLQAKQMQCYGSCQAIFTNNGTYSIITEAVADWGGGGRAHVWYAGCSPVGQMMQVKHVLYNGFFWWGMYDSVDTLPVRTLGNLTEVMLGSNVNVAVQSIYYPEPGEYFTRSNGGWFGMGGATQDYLGMPRYFPSLMVEPTGGRPYSFSYNAQTSDLEVQRWNWNSWGNLDGGAGATMVTVNNHTIWFPSGSLDNFYRVTTAYSECYANNDPGCNKSVIGYTGRE